MATTSQNLLQAIQGLWRDRSNDPAQLPACLGFAPTSPMLGNGQYQIITTDLRLDLADPAQNAAVSSGASYAESPMEFDTVDVATQRYTATGIVLPFTVIEAIEGQNGFVNLADKAMQAVSNQLLSGLNQNFITAAAAGLAAPTAGGLTLAVLSTDIVAYFNSVVQEIEQASGSKVTHALIGKTALMAFANMDAVANGFGIAVTDAAAIGAGGRARLGYTDPSRVHAFFRDMWGIELLVEDRTFVTAAGAGQYGLTTQMVIGNAEQMGGAMQTFSRAADVVSFNVRDTAFPNVEGLAVTADANYVISTTDATSARLIALTLP